MSTNLQIAVGGGSRASISSFLFPSLPPRYTQGAGKGTNYLRSARDSSHVVHTRETHILPGSPSQDKAGISTPVLE